MATQSAVMIDIAPLLPLLDIARTARDELAESEARFQALSGAEQQQQIDGILDYDRPRQQAYDDAVSAVVAALLERTAPTSDK